MKSLLPALLCLALFAPSVAYADSIIDTVGDIDLLGGRSNGSTVTTGVFDNRSAAEMAATDGSQFTDRANGTYGWSVDFVDFFHTYTVTGGTIQSASVTFGIGGLETNDNDPNTKSFGEDGLFVDGILVADAFEALIQGSNDYDVYTVNLTGAALAALQDGSATIRIDTNSYGGTQPGGGGASPVWYDYVTLRMETGNAVPEPGTLALLGLGLVGVVGLRRRRNAA